MSANKIVRSICYFTENPNAETVKELAEITRILEQNGYLVQTRRLCAPVNDITSLVTLVPDGVDYLSIGTISIDDAVVQLPALYKHGSALFNVDLSTVEIEEKHVDILFQIIKNSPARTFNFTYVFNNIPSSPFFPSGSYERDGFSIGLQPIDLAESCATLTEWLNAMKGCWTEICQLFESRPDFLGIDGSTAPLVGEKGSLVALVKKFCYDFNRSVTTDTYTKITKFLKDENPKPAGLNGLMLPCLEDTELAGEYEKGNFSIERNIYLSLHSGLGIDTYPIGVDESPARVLQILTLLQALSNKYKKPLSARFVSDGETRIGERTNYKNQYLAECTIRAL